MIAPGPVAAAVVRSWMLSLGFAEPVVRHLRPGVLECAGVLFAYPEGPRRRLGRTVRPWDSIGATSADVAALAPLDLARAIAASADAQGVALFVVEPSGTARAANDVAADLQANLVRVAVGERERRRPPIVVPCPLCGNQFSDDDGYRLHLDAAHGLVDDPGARTSLPVVADVATSQTPPPRPPARMYLTSPRGRVIGRVVTPTNPRDQGVKYPQTRVSDATAKTYRRLRDLRWGHG